MWLHWAPYEWRGPLPFEIGLFFFLTLTGFLITRILLRYRGMEESGSPWRREAFREFMGRRFARILTPCYAAMGFALLVGARDIREHPWAYLLHVSNFHMAWLPEWPWGTAHYWTLAIQMQFYLFWPVVVFFAPRRSLAWVFAAAVLLAPLSRLLLERFVPEVHFSQAITTSAMDYFGCGALLALALERGMRPGDGRLRALSWVCLAAYLVLYVANEAGHRIPVLWPLQQTLLAIAVCGLISATLAGLGGPLGRVLDHGATQHIGRISYGLYLFHTLVPLALGRLLPQLWMPVFDGPLRGLRLLVFAVAAWLMAWACWRWLEKPSARGPRLAGDRPA